MSMKDSVRMVANLMEIAARTAPKAVGKDFIEIKVLSDEEKNAIGNEMLSMAQERGSGFERDGRNILDADVLVIVGLMPHKGVGLNCGACGCQTCAEFNEKHTKGDFNGPNCSIRMLDLGIALGSAVKTASSLNVDNRIIYRVGVAAKRLSIGESNIIQGIPLSATGKNIFFDRK